jgi:hypothetical protein
MKRKSTWVVCRKGHKNLRENCPRISKGWRTWEVCPQCEGRVRACETPTFGPDRPRQAAGEKTAPAPIVVTDENVEELKKRFDALPQGDPEHDRLGDALHRHMIGKMSKDELEEFLDRRDRFDGEPHWRPRRGRQEG